jgi:hypothetical protein
MMLRAEKQRGVWNLRAIPVMSETMRRLILVLVEILDVVAMLLLECACWHTKKYSKAYQKISYCQES